MTGFSPFPVPIISQTLAPVAATPVGGFALQNATPTIFTYTTPNDGKIHTIFLSSLLVVTSAETGGAYGINLTEADGTNRTPGINAGGGAAGATRNLNSFQVQPNTTVTLEQTSALTAGAASVWAQLFAY